MKVNSGNDAQARMMGGDVAGVTGTSSSFTATSLTASGTPFVSSTLVGHMVAVGSVYGIITANTTSVLTVDRWYTPGSPGGAAASTPTGTPTFVVLPGQAPAWYMGLGNTNTSPSATDTSMSGEITTAGGGLIRQLAVYAHTTGAASYTLTGTFTANGSDSLPVTAYRIGVFQSLVSNLMVFETTLSAQAAFAASGDQLVVTETVSL